MSDAEYVAMTHPLQQFSSESLVSGFKILLGATLVCVVALGFMGNLANVNTDGKSMWRMQRTTSEAEAQVIVDAWSQDDAKRRWALFSLSFDFIFIAVYSTLIAIGCVLVAQNGQLPTLLSTFGVLVAWAQLLAALFDCIENAFQFTMILSRSGELAPYTSTASSAKWLLIGLGVAYMIVGWVIARLR